MAFGWLEQIGSGIKRGIKRIPGALEQLGDGLDQDEQPMPRRPMPVTPGFNPNASMPRYGADSGDTSRIGLPLGQSGQGQAAQPPPISPAHPQIPPATRPRVVETEQPQNHPPLTGFDQGTGQMVQSPYSPAGRPQPITSRVVPPMVEGGNPMRHARIAPTEEMPIPGLPNRGGPVPYSDYDAARYSKVMEGAKRSPDGVLLGKDEGGGFKRSWKNSLQNAALGAQRAIQANPQGGLGAMLGGAVGGGLGATFNVQAGLENVFDAGPGRSMLEDQARRDTQTEQQRKMRMGGLGERGATADVTIKESQARRASQRRIGEATWGTYDQDTGQPIWERPAGATSSATRYRGIPGVGTLDTQTGEIVDRYPTREKPPTMQDAIGEEEAEEGSVEQITQDSYAGRGGRDYVISKMPPQLQQVLKNPAQPDMSQLPKQYAEILNDSRKAAEAETVSPGITVKAEQARNQLISQHQQLYMQAYNELQQMEQRELADIRRQAESTRRSNAAKRRVGGATRPSGGQGSATPKARLSDLKKYLND